MKKLFIKIKAKRYDKAIERAESLVDFCSDSELKTLEYVFPELKEELEDEKIRKALIFDYRGDDCLCTKEYRIDFKDIRAWLEKQGEKSIDVLDEEEREFADNIDSFRKEIDDSYQKGYNEGVRVTLEKQCEQKPTKVRTTGYWNVQDIEPRFKVGQTIKKEDFNSGFTIVKIEDGFYYNNTGDYFPFTDQDNWELVEQKSADIVEPKFKKGNWVVRDNTIAQILDIQEQYYVGLDIEGNDFTSSRFLSDNKIHLWTIADAKDGDVLAFNNNNIVIFKDLYNTTSFHSYCYIEDGIFFISKDEMPDWWVEEGFHPATKEQRDTLIKAMANAGYTFDFEKKELMKIEQKSQRMISAEAKETLYDKPAWSEEDEAKLKSILFHIEDVENKDVINWLKSLKDRIQPKQEWNEEDKQYFNFLEKLLICLQAKSTEGEIKKGTNSNSEYYYKVIQWLKSLRPQNYWKPSDEQMSALISILPVIRGSGDKVQNILETLYDDLKKLNEE